MSTSAAIILSDSRAFRVHWDGYPANMVPAIEAVMSEDRGLAGFDVVASAYGWDLSSLTVARGNVAAHEVERVGPLALDVDCATVGGDEFRAAPFSRIEVLRSGVQFAYVVSESEGVVVHDASLLPEYR